jgi:hypothetical protein
VNRVICTILIILSLAAFGIFNQPKVYILGIRHLPVVLDGETEAWALDYAVNGEVTNGYFYSKASLMEFAYHLKSLGTMEGKLSVFDTFPGSATFLRGARGHKTVPR